MALKFVPLTWKTFNRSTQELEERTSENVLVSIDEKFMTVRIALDPATVADARPSKSGKSKLVGNTGGFAPLGEAAEALKGWSMNLVVTAPKA